MLNWKFRGGSSQEEKDSKETQCWNEFDVCLLNESRSKCEKDHRKCMRDAKK